MTTGVVHRDLKSLNLLLDSKWNIKVCGGFSEKKSAVHLCADTRSTTHPQVSDFGLTEFLSQLKKDHSREARGTLQWMAPELLGIHILHGVLFLL